MRNRIEVKKMKNAAEKNHAARSLASWLLSLSLLAGAGVCVASAQTQPKPAPAGAAEAKAAPDKEKVREVAVKGESLVTELDVNGLKVLVKRREGSQTVAAGLFLRGGARNVTAENAGIEALMWSAATEASAAFPRATLRKELARTGTALGYGVNRDYSALTLGTTRANFDRSWEIFADVAQRPAFTPDDFKRVQNQLVVARSDDEDSPDSFLEILQERVTYSGHPYSNDPDGTAQSLARLTLEDVRAYHKRMMQTSRLLLVVVGDLDAQALRERISATFGRLPRGDYKQEALPQFSFTRASVDVTERQLPTNYVQGVFAAPPLTSADYYPMRIASELLNDRVLIEVRFRRNLSYAPNAFLRSQGANLGGIYVTSVDANQAVSVMLYEISRLQNEPADPAEINVEINGYLTRYYMGQETNAAQAGELAMYELIGGGWRNSVDLLARIRAVTPADVQRVARAYMRNLRFVVIGDPKRVDRNVFTTQAGE